TPAISRRRSRLYVRSWPERTENREPRTTGLIVRFRFSVLGSRFLTLAPPAIDLVEGAGGRKQQLGPADRCQRLGGPPQAGECLATPQRRRHAQRLAERAVRLIAIGGRGGMGDRDQRASAVERARDRAGQRLSAG